MTTEMNFPVLLADFGLLRDPAYLARLCALDRVWKHAQGLTGQCRITSAFLLGLYNGRRFPFDLTSFRGLDDDLVRDCLIVLELDATPRAEVHELLEVPGAEFEALAQRWGLGAAPADFGG